MSVEPQTPARIAAPEAADLAAVLTCVMQGVMPAADARRAADELIDQSLKGTVVIGPVLGAWRGAQFVGAIWAQPQGAAAFTLWLPRVASSEPEETTAALVGQILDEIDRQGARMAQALVRPKATSEAGFLERFGFSTAAELVYLYSDQRDWPHAWPEDTIQLDPAAKNEQSRLRDVVEATYAETLDCPALDGLRSATDALEEYRKSPGYDPRLWFFVREAGQDVGCLILADHAEQDHWELVYVGVVPAARGRGLGLRVVRQAQHLARVADRGRIVLAVDVANRPAVAMYEASGFGEWDRRRVMMKTWPRS